MPIPRPPPEPTPARATARLERDRDRLRKLLALAADQAGSPEGQAAAAKARMLLRRLAHERQRPGQRAAEPTIEQLRLSLGAPSPWRRRLAAAVASHCATVAAWPEDPLQVVFFGRRSALLIAEYLLAVLLREVVEARDAWRAAQPEASGAALNGFCHSAVTAIEHRLRDQREAERGADREGSALVRYEGDSVEAWLRAQGVGAADAPPSPYGFNQAGYIAGHGIPVHGGVAAAAGRAALGPGAPAR